VHASLKACGVKKLDRRFDLAIRRQAASSPDLAHAPGCEVSAPLRSASPAGSVRPRGAGSGDGRAPPSAEDPQARRGATRFTTADRAFLAAAARLLSPDRRKSFLVGRDTLVRWHRELAVGRRRRSRRPGRPPVDPSITELILRLGRENPRWGYLRIRGELLKLGVDISATTIATVLRRGGLGPAPRRIGPTWTQFLRLQAYALLSPASGPTRRTTWRTGQVVRSEHRPRSVTSRPRPSMAKSSMTTRRVRTGSPPSPWVLGCRHR
jgi:hypothetical protein